MRVVSVDHQSKKDAPVDFGRQSNCALDEVLSTIEEDIVLGFLHPRERLIEDALMARFKTKRHIVRTALVYLERSGLVERRPNQGAQVCDRSPQEVEQLYAMRELLETAAARMIPLPADRELLRTLASIQQRHDDAYRASDIRSAFRINIEFHRALFNACGNSYLAETIELFGRKAHAIRSLTAAQPEYLKKARDEHRAMLRALSAADRNRLVTLCREHIAMAKRAYIDIYRARFPGETQIPAKTGS